MSSISSSDLSMVNHYANAIKELERDKEAEKKRQREARREEMNQLEERYKQALVEKDRDASETIARIREKSLEALSDERELHKQQLDNFKEKSYNARGISRSGGQENELAEKYRRSAEELSKELDLRTKKNQEAMVRQEDQFAKQNQMELRKKDKEYEESVKNLKDNFSQASARERANLQEELEKTRKQIYNAKGVIQESVPLDQHRREIEDLRAAAAKRHEIDLSNAENREKEVHNQVDTIKRKQDRKIHELSENHAEETKDLQNQIKDLNNFKFQTSKDSAKVLVDKSRELSADQKREIQRIESTFDKNKDKLEEDIKAQEHYYQRHNREAIKEREAHYASLMAEQSQETRQKMKELQKNYEQQIHQLIKERDIDEKRSEQRLEKTLHRANENRRVALENQAHAFSETIDRMKSGYKTENDVLQKELVQRKTSKDVNLVSPAAEAAIRENTVREYDKAFKIEAQKNKQSVEDLYQRQTDRYNSMVADFRDKETRSNQQNELDRNLERAQFIDKVQETEHHANSKVRETEVLHDREKERLYRQFANSMEKIRREYDHILDTSRADAQAKLAGFRQEAVNDSKMLQRSLTARQNEIIRDYEKKLNDQKMDYEYKLEDVKTTARVEMRDSERRAKQELEAQARSFEQRIAQMEAQNKERERYIAQNYQDELDRTRRAYELLNKKKG